VNVVAPCNCTAAALPVLVLRSHHAVNVLQMPLLYSKHV
jgi:hypothetical protein